LIVQMLHIPALEKPRSIELASNEASAQAERERRESEWRIEDLDQGSKLLFAL